MLFIEKQMQLKIAISDELRQSQINIANFLSVTVPVFYTDT